MNEMPNCKCKTNVCGKKNPCLLVSSTKSFPFVIEGNYPRPRNFSNKQQIMSSSSSSSEQLKATVSRIVNDDNNFMNSKKQLLEIANQIIRTHTADNDVLEEVGVYILNIMKQTNHVYDDIDLLLRKQLFHYYIEQQQYLPATSMLIHLNFETNTQLSLTDKIDLYLQIAETFLLPDVVEDDGKMDDGVAAVADGVVDAVQAEVYVNKASVLMQQLQQQQQQQQTGSSSSTTTTTTQTDHRLQLRFKTTFAQILDANRKFLDASVRYYELSTTTVVQINKQDLLLLLSKAITCALLASATTARTRFIQLLVNDERLLLLCSTLPQYSAHVTLLNRVHRVVVVDDDDVFAAFEQSLASHQRALMSDGFSLPRKRLLLEHNLFAVQSIFDNISITSLTTLLHLNNNNNNNNNNATIQMVAKMLGEGLLTGYIDEVAAVVVFREQTQALALTRWDDSIASTCNEITRFCDAAALKYPQLLATPP